MFFRIGLTKVVDLGLMVGALSVSLVFLLLISSMAGASAPGADPDILGLRLGTSVAAVRELFDKSGISMTQTGPQELSAPRTLRPLEGVKEVRVSFDKDRLRKIVVFFEIPPLDHTADNLVLLYRKEKDRLTQLFGPPGLDHEDMKAPSSTERREWLTRGLGYYRAVWKVKDTLDLSLWLCGEESGILFFEMYEKPDGR